jgi:hypothetical protein
MKHAKNMNPLALEEYAEERKSLTKEQKEKILLGGRKWDLSQTLKAHGSCLFPHTYLRACGEHIASCVHGCLDSGTDSVLLLGVLHPLSSRLFHSRCREIDNKDISKEKCWGILGPGLGHDDCWKNEFSLLNFLFLWEAEVERRGIRSPKLFIRYPCLADRHPEKLPGIDELKSIAKDSVVIGTSDLCHHGVAYGTSHEKALEISADAYLFARYSIMKSIELLKTEDYDTYYHACIETKSDSLDVGTILRYLLGPLDGHILDLQLADTASLYYGHPKPSWVAASLVELSPL